MKIKKSLSETEQYLGCLNQDPAVQKVVYDSYYPMVYAICLRYLRETAAAEDVLIEGFMKVFKRIHQFKGNGSFCGWIRRMMVNECLMYREKNKGLYNFIGLDSIVPPVVRSQPSDDLEVEDLMKLINNLPLSYKTVFNLYVLEGYSHHEIAEKLNISENTSKSQLSRARLHLKKMVL